MGIMNPDSQIAASERYWLPRDRSSLNGVLLVSMYSPVIVTILRTR